jgi:hypothetical protein
MDITERYFFAAATAMFLVLLASGFCLSCVGFLDAPGLAGVFVAYRLNPQRLHVSSQLPQSFRHVRPPTKDRLR